MGCRTLWAGGPGMGFSAQGRFSLSSEGPIFGGPRGVLRWLCCLGPPHLAQEACFGCSVLSPVCPRWPSKSVRMMWTVAPGPGGRGVRPAPVRAPVDVSAAQGDDGPEVSLQAAVCEVAVAQWPGGRAAPHTAFFAPLNSASTPSSFSADPLRDFLRVNVGDNSKFV